MVAELEQECQEWCVLVRFVVKTHKASSVLLRNNGADAAKRILLFWMMMMMKMKMKMIHQFARQ